MQENNDPAPPGAPEPDAEAHTPDPADLLAQREAERDDMRDRWLRAEAELQNVRTRAKRDIDDARQYAVQKFAKDVVEAHDNIRRGLDNLPAAHDAESEVVTKLRNGFEGVERSFLALLERNGISRTDPAGTPFDADLHQAMAEHETTEHPPGTVVTAWSPAWTLNGRLLRPAMVVVSKSPAGATEIQPGTSAEG